MDNVLPLKNEKKDKSFKDFVNRPVVRGSVNVIFDLVIAVYTAFLPQMDETGIIGLIIIGIVDLVVIALYNIQNVNIRASISKLQEKNAILLRSNNCDSALIESMDKSCEDTIEDASGLIDDVIDPNGSPSFKTWSFKQACKKALERMSSILKEYTKTEDGSGKFEIYYDRIIRKPNSAVVRTIACSTDETADPSIRDKDRILEKDEYYDVHLVRQKKMELVCLLNKDEVKKAMLNRKRFDNVVKMDLEKYNQVVFVPVLCRKRNLIGVLVISCLDNTVLGNTVKEVKEVIHKLIEPYLHLLVVFYKLEKVFKLEAIKEE